MVCGFRDEPESFRVLVRVRAPAAFKHEFDWRSSASFRGLPHTTGYDRGHGRQADAANRRKTWIPRSIVSSEAA